MTFLYILQGNLQMSNRVQFFSTSATPIKTSKVGKFLTLRHHEKPPLGGAPLVLFFSWLFAKDHTLEKYCALYHRRGWDVLTIQSDPTHFLWPTNSGKVVQEVLDYVQEKTPKSQPLLVHALSIGAFIYTRALMKMAEEEEVYGNVRNRIRAQVFDSIVAGNLVNMANGIALGMSGNDVIQAGIRSSIMGYFALTQSSTVDVFDKTIDAFWNNHLRRPIHCFFSKDDPMCDPVVMEEKIADWRKRAEFPVSSKCWDKSIHAGHLKVHTEEYVKELDVFLDNVNL